MCKLVERHVLLFVYGLINVKCLTLNMCYTNRMAAAYKAAANICRYKTTGTNLQLQGTHCEYATPM